MIYGHDRTIHRTTCVNVETDEQGHVVAVWYRCMALPFTHNVASAGRAADMRAMYKDRAMPPILAIEFAENEHERGAGKHN